MWRPLMFSFAGQAISAVIAFSSMLAVSRLLTPYEVGLYAAGAAVYGLLVTLANFGVGFYLIRAQEITDHTRIAAFTSNGLLSICTAGGMLLLGCGSQYIFEDDRIGDVICLFAALPLISILTFLPQSLLQRDLKFEILTVIDVSGAVTVAVLSILFSYLGFGPLGLVLALIVSSLQGVIIVYALAENYVSTKISTKGIGQVFLFGFQMLFVNGLSQGFGRLMEIFLARVLGVAYLGFYSRANSLSTQFFNGIYGSFTKVMYASMAETARNDGNIRENYLRALRVVVSVFWPFIIGIALLSKELIYLFLGSAWSPVVMPFAVLMLANFVIISFGMNWELFVIRNRLRQQIKYEGIRYSLGFGIFMIGCEYGLHGAAIARLLEAIIGFLLYFPWLIRLSGAGYRDFLRIYLEGAVLTALTSTPILLSIYFEESLPMVPALRILMDALLAACFWAGGLFFAKNPIWVQMILSLKNFKSYLTRC